MYDAILVPTDGSESSMAAVNQATEIAESESTTVHFLHVIDIGTEMSASGSGNIVPQLMETLEEEADSALNDAVNRAEETGINYHRTTCEGDPYEVIAEYSTEHDIDLIAMGASGRSGLKKRLLGSTPDRVIRTVDTSILLARP